MGIQSYRDLKVWQKAMDLVERCYQITKFFPKDELFGLTSQIRRAAVSIPSNIAEGSAREHTKELLYHLAISYGSLAELETDFQIAKRLGYIHLSTYNQVSVEATNIGKMLNGLRRSLSTRIS